MPEPLAEARHPPGPERAWAETWSFAFALPDASLGGWVDLTLLPNAGVAWYWASLVGQGRSMVLVRDAEVPLPRGRPLEVRTEGLWAELVCEEPLEHWSLGLEAFGLGFDDPTEAWRGERGDRTALGLDLGWEATGPAQASGDRDAGAAGVRADATWDGYEQAGEAHGEVLVGRERLPFTGPGWRSHRWGLALWWQPGRTARSGAAAEQHAQGARLHRAPLLLGTAGELGRLDRWLSRSATGVVWEEEVLPP